MCPEYTQTDRQDRQTDRTDNLTFNARHHDSDVMECPSNEAPHGTRVSHRQKDRQTGQITLPLMPDIMIVTWWNVPVMKPLTVHASRTCSIMRSTGFPWCESTKCLGLSRTQVISRTWSLPVPGSQRPLPWALAWSSSDISLCCASSPGLQIVQMSGEERYKKKLQNLTNFGQFLHG